MKKLSLFLIGLLLIPSLFLTSCDRGDDITEGGATTYEAFDVLKDYMENNGFDLPSVDTNTFGKFVTAAPAADALDAFLSGHYILDIRKEADFKNGHIEGAKNIAFADILTEATNAGGKPILMVCYSGQTACFATALMRMYGITEVQALKWGMSGWNSNTAGAWNNATQTSIAENNPNWSTSSAPQNVPYKDVDLGTTTDDDGLALLHKRIEDIVALGDNAFSKFSASVVLDTPGDYFINNFFSEGDYDNFGHIKGAYRIQPLTLASDEYKNLDATKKIVTYCYTGQTSAVVTAWLRVLGYDAYSLLYGMNGLYNDNPAWGTSANRWTSSMPKDLPLIVENN